MASEKKEVVVLGAGVIGLTTALKIQETGRYKVSILAEVLPTDPKTIKYASQWAGAHHVSFAKVDDPRHALDKETFAEMWELSKSEAEGCFMQLEQAEYFTNQRESPSPLEHMPEFRSLSPNEIPVEAVSGEAFNTITIDVPSYLNYLLARFLSKGGRVLRGSVQHIAQIAESGVHAFLPASERQSDFTKTGFVRPAPPAAIVVCVGLGARYLGGVEDADVYPIRGQTVLVQAPWIKHGKTLSDLDAMMWTYMIPRRTGLVILGGTLEPDDWNATPRAETTRSILERALKLSPELVPPHLRSAGADAAPTVEDILPFVVEEGCGFRPGRKGGLRLEAGNVKVPLTDKTIPVVYNYGHAGSGYIASFGSARVALELLETALGSKH
ncbi:D-amino-acid oxidase [Ephemerocybe angulata]|uniref:D-amino-acid oxidase n=1 Tax=Ephemerocybe angulata TaxID=980116 RepID=A0A8H6HER0_9AGAR|nr:D-amino-acid oxidase [Tulosesus angulatus]